MSFFCKLWHMIELRSITQKFYSNKFTKYYKCFAYLEVVVVTEGACGFRSNCAYCKRVGSGLESPQ